LCYFQYAAAGSQLLITTKQTLKVTARSLSSSAYLLIAIAVKSAVDFLPQLSEYVRYDLVISWVY